MNRNTSPNSLEAYDNIKPNLNQSQEAIFEAIEFMGKCSAKQLAHFSNLPINTVVGRINELMYDKQAIKIYRVMKIGSKKQNVNVYTVRSKNDPPNVRKKTYKELYEELLKKHDEMILKTSIETNNATIYIDAMIKTDGNPYGDLDNLLIHLNSIKNILTNG